MQHGIFIRCQALGEGLNHVLSLVWT